MIYTGVITAESLHDPTVINDLMVEKVHISSAEHHHLYQVKLTMETITHVARELKSDWYLLFWRKDHLLVIFGGGKQFFLDPKDSASWTEAIEYGQSQGFAREVLDFSPKEL